MPVRCSSGTCSISIAPEVFEGIQPKATALLYDLLDSYIINPYSLLAIGPVFGLPKKSKKSTAKHRRELYPLCTDEGGI
jgi:hypothetical protein